MRRLMTVALIGLAVATVSTDALAQGRGRGRPDAGRSRGGVIDTARARRMDSIRVARGDTAWRRGPGDSLRVRGMDANRPGRGRGGARPGDIANVRRTLAGIQLTETEKASVKTITQKYAAEFKQLRQSNDSKGAGRSPELRARVKTLADRERVEIRAVLTPEHQAQFDANVARRRAKGKPGS